MEWVMDAFFKKKDTTKVSTQNPAQGSSAPSRKIDSHLPWGREYAMLPLLCLMLFCLEILLFAYFMFIFL